MASSSHSLFSNASLLEVAVPRWLNPLRAAPNHCAGAIAEEAIGSLRTVAAMGGEAVELERYQGKLELAKASAIAAGVKAGTLLGVMLLIVFCSYAVGMSFGAGQVRAVTAHACSARASCSTACASQLCHTVLHR